MAEPKMDSEVPVRVLEDAMEGEPQIAPKGLKEAGWLVWKLVQIKVAQADNSLEPTAQLPAHDRRPSAHHRWAHGYSAALHSA